MGSLGWPEILIILVVLVLLFGAKRLPDLARSLGQSTRVFKGEMKGLREDGTATEASPTVTRPAPLPTTRLTPPTAQDATPPPTHAPGSTTSGQ